jgi:hypothetical protein
MNRTDPMSSSEKTYTTKGLEILPDAPKPPIQVTILFSKAIETGLSSPPCGKARKEYSVISPKGLSIPSIPMSWTNWEAFFQTLSLNHLSGYKRTEIREFFRRIDKSEFTNWIDSLRSLPECHKNEKVALQSLDWQNPIFDDASLENYALRAFIEGDLDRPIVSEILIYAACKKHQGTIVGNLNGEHFSIFKKSIEKYFSYDDIRIFKKAISKIPENRLQFYAVPIREEENVVSRIEEAFFTCFIYKDPNTGKKYQIIPTPFLAHELYKAKYGNQVCRPNLVLGASKGISNFLKPDERDVLIPSTSFPGSTPITADTYSANEVEFYYHDVCYHLLLSSANIHKKAWNELSIVLAQSEGFKMASAPFSYPGKDIYFTFFDQEFRMYIRPDNIRFSPSERFWMQILTWSGTAFSETLEPIFGHILNNKSRWKKDYGIDLHGLLESKNLKYNLIPFVKESLQKVYEKNRALQK